jgi:hypothetical protein
MTLAATMLGDDALRATENGFELDVRLNWYRSLPLSAVKTLELTVDGEAIPPDEITFAVNGHEYPLGTLAERWDETWFVLDAATLRVRRPLVRAGAPVDVRLKLGSRIPYILLGPEPLEYVSERGRVLRVR